MIKTYSIQFGVKTFPVKYTKSLRVYNKASFDRNLLRGFIDQVGQWKMPERDFADNAIFAIMDDGLNPLAVTDGQKLISIAAYAIVNGNAVNEIPAAYNSYYNKFIYLSWLAGNGNGGGVIVVRELMQIAESMNVPILLEAVNNSDTFYRKVGFVESSLKSRHYYWLPSGIEDDFDNDGILWTDID
jgi:hypothetical protein